MFELIAFILAFSAILLLVNKLMSGDEETRFVDYDVTNSLGHTMHVNSVNKDMVDMFMKGYNPRCGWHLNNCSEGLAHSHGDIEF